METDLLQIQTELEKRVYHLKTLCDISRDLTEITTPERTVRNFLLMTMGNFGTQQGIVLIQDAAIREDIYFVQVGFSDDMQTRLQEAASRMLSSWRGDRDMDQEPALSADLIDCTVPFAVDGELQGLVGLGPKLVEEPYEDEDRELLSTLLNTLSISLQNARRFESIQGLNETLQEKNVQLEQALDELDRRVYHLKTLYDVSKDIFSTVDSRTILRDFLLMTMGNFGVTRGFVGISDGKKGKMDFLEFAGYEEQDLWNVKSDLRRIFSTARSRWVGEDGCILEDTQDLPHETHCGVPFCVEEGCYGFLGLGKRLIPEPYSAHDRELLNTLVNNLVIAFRNARAFEKIQKLNRELQKALRKVELLESIKANLCKFVPSTVTRLVEKSPTDEVLDAQERDVSVLFLDIEGYTKITERIGATAVNTLIEKYFSGFMEAIYANNGDVLETSGDGLMVLFLSEDEKTHAMEAVQAAAAIRENTLRINREEGNSSDPVIVNIGVCSGPAFVGAAKFDSLTGSRWAYTSHGNTTNIAARICSQARGGQALVSKSTAERVKANFRFQPLGSFSLKNVSEQVELFSLNER
jgi:class 3 adenylate cyclase